MIVNKYIAKPSRLNQVFGFPFETTSKLLAQAHFIALGAPQDNSN